MLTSLPAKAVPFVDIRDGLTLAQAVVDTVRDPLVVLDPNLRVIAASRSFFQTFRLVTDDVIGHLLYEIDGGQWNIPELRAPFRNDHGEPVAYRRIRSRSRVSGDRSAHHALECA